MNSGKDAVRLERCPTKCMGKLRHGECRRVPRAPSRYLAGYYLGCPGCGLPEAVTTADATILEEGMDVDETPLLSISRVACSRCGAVYRIDRDEIVFVEAARA